MKKTKFSFLFLTLFTVLASIGQPPPPPPTASVWTGAVSTDWFDASNWNGIVPDGNTDARIPNTLRKPVISFDLVNFGSAAVRNITFSAGAGITLSANCFLDLGGDWSAPSSVLTVQGSGVVNPTGGDPTTYHTFTGYTSFNDLFMNGYYQVGSGNLDKIDIRGRLNLGSGDINTRDKVSLKSTVNYTGFIAQDGGTITGKITMERYVPTGGGFHHLSSAVTDGTVGSWASSFSIVGPDGVRSGVSVPSCTLQEYREAANTNNILDSGYYNYTGLNRPLVPGTGYTAIIPSPRVVKTFGTPNLNNFTVTITKTAGTNGSRGWNFLGNPYPAPMSWSSTYGEIGVGSVLSTVYVWKSGGNPRTGSWLAVDGISHDTIPSSQGFFVYCQSATAEVNFFMNGGTVNAYNPRFYKNMARQNEIKLKISGTEDGVSELTAYTAPDATDGIDALYDGVMPPALEEIDNPIISFRINGENYLTHATDQINSHTEMPLDITINKAGVYTLSASSISVTDYPVYILDKVSGSYYDLAKDNITITAQSHEEIKGRYTVVFSKGNGMDNIHTTNVYTAPGTIIVERSANTTAPAQVIVTDVLGRQVSVSNMDGESIRISASGPDQIYIVTVRSADTETIKKVCTK